MKKCLSVSSCCEFVGNRRIHLIRVSRVISGCEKIQSELIHDVTAEDDRKEFLGEYNLQESGLNKLIRAAYHLLDLVTYFTAGEKEVRAWTIHKGWKAPQAAGVIHGDL